MSFKTRLSLAVLGMLLAVLGLIVVDNWSVWWMFTAGGVVSSGLAAFWPWKKTA